MRHSMTFHRSWDCLAPAPSFMRTVRLLVATAVAATAGFYDSHALGDVIGDPGA